MSYDLYFQSKMNEDPLSKPGFIDYFRNRPWYKVEGNQAWYSNDHTGVYFCFDYHEETSSNDEIVEEEPSYIACFNLNYNRPHIFGLEAEPEVKKFVEQFKLDIFDPQSNGMGEGPYSTEGFLRGWNEGNTFGIFAINQADAFKNISTLPLADIERYWKWNFFCEKLQDEQTQLGIDVFVPRIMFSIDRNIVKSFIVWGDAIPIVLPKVDMLFLIKKKLAPFRLFSQKPLPSIVEYNSVAGLFPSEEMYSGQGLPYKVLNYKNPPQKIREFFLKQKPGTLTRIAVDQIIDAELVAKAKESASSREIMKLEDQPEVDKS